MVVVFFGKFCSVTDQQVRGWLAARWTIIRRSCRLADFEPDDLIAVVDVSAPVDAYSTGIPATDYPTAPASPQYYHQYPPPSPRNTEPYRSDDEICPQTPEYCPYFGDDAEDDFPIDLTLSPTPIPRRAPASTTPPTPPSPPTRYATAPARRLLRRGRSRRSASGRRSRSNSARCARRGSVSLGRRRVGTVRLVS